MFKGKDYNRMKKLNYVRQITFRLAKEEEDILLQLKLYYSEDRDTEVLKRLMYDKMIDIALGN
jgi:hypothetical protein